MPPRGRPFREVRSLLHAPSRQGSRVLFVFLAECTHMNRYKHEQGHLLGGAGVGTEKLAMRANDDPHCYLPESATPPKSLLAVALATM